MARPVQSTAGLRSPLLLTVRALFARWAQQDPTLEDKLEQNAWQEEGWNRSEARGRSSPTGRERPESSGPGHTRDSRENLCAEEERLLNALSGSVIGDARA